MPRQYLDVPYRSKDAAKALGARFDGTVKRWDVEAGVDLVAFTAWLPVGTTAAAGPATELAVQTPIESGLANVKKGIALSRLLNGVASAVAQAFASGVWTLVEVNEATVRNGHVYLELAERDASGYRHQGWSVSFFRGADLTPAARCGLRQNPASSRP